MYSCDVLKAELLQSSVSHDPSEIISYYCCQCWKLILWKLFFSGFFDE